MVLSWDKPQRKMSKEDWKAISADGAPPGVYTPNMSEADKAKWKAVKKGQNSGDLRVEIRKTVSGDTPEKQHCYAQVLLVVRKDSVALSCNGTAVFTADEADEMAKAIAEARLALLGCPRVGRG